MIVTNRNFNCDNATKDAVMNNVKKCRVVKKNANQRLTMTKPMTKPMTLR